MKRTNGGAQWWSEDKSFYLALMLCLAAIAVAAYLLFAFPNGTSDDDTMQAQEYQADDSVAASEALERIPIQRWNGLVKAVLATICTTILGGVIGAVLTMILK